MINEPEKKGSDGETIFSLFPLLSKRGGRTFGFAANAGAGFSAAFGAPMTLGTVLTRSSFGRFFVFSSADT
jgi:hypothetical protein